MKYFLIFALALSAFSQSATLEWNYNSNAIWQAEAQGQPVYFKIYGTNQPVGSSPTNWQLVSSQPATNYPVIAYDGTNSTYAFTSPIAPGQFFYTSTASNFWGESGFSNTSNVPALPTTVQTKIFKN
jgi:hypothetical protein